MALLSKGFVITDFSNNSNERANSVVIDASGRVVVAGFTNVSGSQLFDFALARYLPTGQPDVSFGTQGKVVTDFGGAFDQAYSVAIDSSGNIVVAGFTNVSGSSQLFDFALARYLPTGQPDVSFGTQGQVITDFGGTDDRAFSVAIDSSGNIVVAGFTNVSGDQYDFALARYLPTGQLDVSFGTQGKVITDFGGTDDTANSVAIDSSGNIVVAGATDASSNQYEYNFALARYLHTGQPDVSFGTQGKVITDFGGTDDTAISVAIDASNGNIVVAGYTNVSNDLYDFAVARYLPTGQPDVSFGTQGKVITDFGGNDDTAYSVAIDASGNIVVAGFTSVSSDQDEYDFALARYLPTGQLDVSFGTQGKVVTDFGGTYDGAFSMAIDRSTGRIVVAGTTNANANGNYDFAVGRYTVGGQLDRSFGDILTSTTSLTEPITNVLSVEYNGYVYVVKPSGDVDFAKSNSDDTLGSWIGTTPIGVVGIDSSTAVAFANRGYIYILAVAGSKYAALNISDGTIGTWSSTTSLPSNLNGGMTSVVYNGYVYIIGGWVSGNTTANVYYTTISGGGGLGATWTSTTSLPVGLGDMTSVVSNGYVYVMGGFDNSGGSAVNTVYYAQLNISGGGGIVGSSWTSTVALPQIVRYAASIVYNGYAYVIGGYANQVPSRDIYYAPLNPTGGVSASSWTTMANVIPNTGGLAQLGAVVNVSGFMYVLGGSNDSDSEGVRDVYYGSLQQPTYYNIVMKEVFNDLTVFEGYFYVVGEFVNAFYDYSSISGNTYANVKLDKTDSIRSGADDKFNRDTLRFSIDGVNFRSTLQNVNSNFQGQDKRLNISYKNSVNNHLLLSPLTTMVVKATITTLSGEPIYSATTTTTTTNTTIPPTTTTTTNTTNAPTTTTTTTTNTTNAPTTTTTTTNTTNAPTTTTTTTNTTIPPTTTTTTTNTTIPPTTTTTTTTNTTNAPTTTTTTTNTTIPPTTTTTTTTNTTIPPTTTTTTRATTTTTTTASPTASFTYKFLKDYSSISNNVAGFVANNRTAIQQLLNFNTDLLTFLVSSGSILVEVTGPVGQINQIQNAVTNGQLFVLINGVLTQAFLEQPPNNIYICFKEGTRILTNTGYVPVESLVPGQLIQTFRHGLVPMRALGRSRVANVGGRGPRSKNRLYMYPRGCEDGGKRPFADLVVTGEHSALVPSLQHGEKKAMTRHFGSAKTTDDQFHLLAQYDARAVPYEPRGAFTVYHFALACGRDFERHYGVYANGMLMESCSVNHLKALTAF
jgi:uncharacterized delta-60 repeat protein